MREKLLTLIYLLEIIFGSFLILFVLYTKLAYSVEITGSSFSIFCLLFGINFLILAYMQGAAISNDSYIVCIIYFVSTVILGITEARIIVTFSRYYFNLDAARLWEDSPHGIKALWQKIYSCCGLTSSSDGPKPCKHSRACYSYLRNNSKSLILIIIILIFGFMCLQVYCVFKIFGHIRDKRKKLLK